MKLKSTKPWHANSTVSFPHVGVVQVDENGMFDVEDQEAASQLIKAGIGIESVESIKNKTQQSQPLEEDDKEELIGNEEDNETSPADIKATVQAMSLDRLKEFAEEQGLPKNKWQRMGLEKLREYILTEMGL